MNWEDAKLFLALVRGGTVRAAATLSGVGHATVARRVQALEISLGAKLTTRTATGLELTPAGEQLRDAAEQMEAVTLATERRITGQDADLEGPIRLSLVDVLATHLLMPDLKRFAALYPAIDLHVSAEYRMVDMLRREADLAIRMSHAPGDELLGRQVGLTRSAAYAHTDYLSARESPQPVGFNWVGIGNGERFPTWVRDSGLPHIPTRHDIHNVALQTAAVRAGMGIGYLPCFIGDADPELRRLDAPENYPAYPIWLVRHPDSRKTRRFKVLSDFLADAMRNHGPLLSGERPRDPD